MINVVPPRSDRNWMHDPQSDRETMAEFERRLAKARPISRAQYLRVKAATLLEQQTPAATAIAIDLLTRVVTNYDNRLEVPFSHELLGVAYRRVGDLAAAEHHFRVCIDTAYENRSGTSHLTELWLAEVLLDQGRTAEAGDLLVLEELQRNLTWNSAIFRFVVACARYEARTGGDPAPWAKQALDLGADRTHPLTKHQDLGLVETDDATLDEMRHLTAARVTGIEPASSAWDGPVSPARIPGTWQSAASGGGGSRSPARRVVNRQEHSGRTRDEWQRVREALTDAGVTGVEDFGRFVNNTAFFRPSLFDERAAAPTLLRLLPDLQTPPVVRSAAGHLRRPWLRDLDGAYEVVRAAYLRWATDPDVGWYLGGTLCRAASRERATDLIELAATAEHGGSRGCIVEALWRFKAVAEVEPLLRNLVADPDVTDMAMSSLQRTIGAEAMAPVLERLLATTDDSTVQEAAERQLRRVRRKLAAHT
jgi:hypothetical protein